MQKKTGAVAGDSQTGEDGSSGRKTNGKAPKKRKAAEGSTDVKVEAEPPKKVNGKRRGRKAIEADPVKAEEDTLPDGKVEKRKAVPTSVKTSGTEVMDKKSEPSAGGRRRSGRVSQK